MVPIVILLEWAWHGWPREMKLGFAGWMAGYALLLAGRRHESGSPYVSDEQALPLFPLERDRPIENATALPKA
jgi:hypothetical protein